MEHGEFGISTLAQESLDWFREHGGIGQRNGVDAICGLTIEKAEKIRRFDWELFKQGHGFDELVRF